jgi:hypothetical protein
MVPSENSIQIALNSLGNLQAQESLVEIKTRLPMQMNT